LLVYLVKTGFYGFVWVLFFLKNCRVKSAFKGNKNHVNTCFEVSEWEGNSGEKV